MSAGRIVLIGFVVSVAACSVRTERSSSLALDDCAQASGGASRTGATGQTSFATRHASHE